MAKLLIPGGIVELLAAAAVNLQEPTQMRSALSYDTKELQELQAIEIPPHVLIFILSQNDLLKVQMQTIHGKPPEPQQLPPFIQLSPDEFKEIDPEGFAQLPPSPEGKEEGVLSTPVHVYAVLTSSHLLVPLLLANAEEEKALAGPADDGGRGIGQDNTPTVG